MGKLEDALENAGGQESGGGGLGGAVDQGGVELQDSNPGTSAEDQIAGKGTGAAEEGSESGPSMPTSPEASQDIPE
jgi:hypothetical protein